MDGGDAAAGGETRQRGGGQRQLPVAWDFRFATGKTVVARFQFAACATCTQCSMYVRQWFTISIYMVNVENTSGRNACCWTRSAWTGNARCVTGRRPVCKSGFEAPVEMVGKRPSNYLVGVLRAYGHHVGGLEPMTAMVF